MLSKCVSGAVHVHIHVDKSEYLIGINEKIPHMNSKTLFVLGSYEYLESGRQN